MSVVVETWHRGHPSHASSSLSRVPPAPESNEVIFWLLPLLPGVASDPPGPSDHFSPICLPSSFVVPFCSFLPLTRPHVCNEHVVRLPTLTDSPRGPGSGSQPHTNIPFLCPSHWLKNISVLPHSSSTTSHHRSLPPLLGMQVLREFSLPVFKDHLPSVQPVLHDRGQQSSSIARSKSNVLKKHISLALSAL